MHLNLLFVALFSCIAAKTHLIVPLYVYPTLNNPFWVAVANASKKIGIVAIVNPNSGPGVGLPNTDYQAALTKLKNTNVTSVGYVATGYGKRNKSLILADLTTYSKWPKQYSVGGIFFDEAATDVKLVGLYQELYNLTKSLFGITAKVITNQGTKVDEVYVGSKRAADIAVVFESSYSSWKSFVPSSYMFKHNNTEFAAIIHTCSKADFNSAFDKAISSNIGYVYVTDDVMSNPYDILPTYFSNQVDYIALKG
jgi:hypothetical protein